MTRYAWPAAGQDESNIAGSRLADQIRARVGSQLDGYNFEAAKDASLAEIMATTGEALNVKSFGAVGDGATDDTTALQAAIDAAEDSTGKPGTGAVVWMPPGAYRVSSDIVVPHGVSLVGSGQVCTRIIANPSATFTNAVVDTNTDGVFALGIQLRDFQIHANGQDRGLMIRGFNEGCTVDGVHVFQHASEGVRIRPGQLPDTNVTQNVTFGQIRVTSPDTADADGIVFDNVRRCTFLAVSVDTVVNRMGYGLRMLGGDRGLVFLRTHLEDCLTPILMGEDAPVRDCHWIGLHISNATHDPDSQNYGGLSGAMAIIQGRSAGSQTIRNTIEQLSINGYDYDYAFVDAETGWSVPGTGDTEEHYYSRIAFHFDENDNPRREWDSRATLPSYETASLPAADAIEDQSILIEETASSGIKLAVYSGGARYSVPCVVANGVATLANGNTTIAVTHGLGVTPDIQDISVTPIESWGSATKFWAHTPTSTQFTIEVDQDPTQDVDFAWTASVQ